MEKGDKILADTKVRPWITVRQRCAHQCCRHCANGQLGNIASRCGPNHWNGSCAGGLRRQTETRQLPQGARIHGPRAWNQDGRHRTGQDLHRLLYECSYRGPQSCIEDSKGQEGCQESYKCNDSTWIWSCQATGRVGRTGQDLHRRRFRMARGRLFNVLRNEPRYTFARGEVCFDKQPKFRASRSTP